jgi:septal ring factor EnvC (AmiA/AmiB activator)
MDSISQVMGNDQDSNSGAVDLKNVNTELSKRDKKISDLQSDRTKLKNLLKKAKVAIDSINEKHKAAI